MVFLGCDEFVVYIYIYISDFIFHTFFILAIQIFNIASIGCLLQQSETGSIKFEWVFLTATIRQYKHFPGAHPLYLQNFTGCGWHPAISTHSTLSPLLKLHDGRADFMAFIASMAFITFMAFIVSMALIALKFESSHSLDPKGFNQPRMLRNSLKRTNVQHSALVKD